MLVAQDRKQARTLFRYIEGLLDEVPMLSRMVVSKTKESIELSNRVSIEVMTASYRSLRGYTCVVLDRVHLPPSHNVCHHAFVDPSGGSRDSMTIAIAHRDGERIVLDLSVERSVGSKNSCGGPIVLS